MSKIKNKSTIPSGMLNPNGLAETLPDPNVQSTTRPPGVLLPPSPGYDSVRTGKNRFQGKGPTGGFRQMTYGEDIGGTGGVLSVVPGETTPLEASEWLPEAEDSLPEGSIIIADRAYKPGTAVTPHQGYGTIPDMGDRTGSRPLSRAWFAKLNPTSVLRQEYQQSPALAVAMAAGLVYVAYLVGNEAERQWGGDRPRGVGTAATSVPATAAGTAGDVTAENLNKIGKAADDAVDKIGKAADDAVNKINQTTKEAAS